MCLFTQHLGQQGESCSCLSTEDSILTEQPQRRVYLGRHNACGVHTYSNKVHPNCNFWVDTSLASQWCKTRYILYITYIHLLYIYNKSIFLLLPWRELLSLFISVRQSWQKRNYSYMFYNFCYTSVSYLPWGKATG